ncbi:hypothetical protein FB451DRAFT_1418644 [Mycena latifolia]|nr:hypothetical protein FB451DRAFT_1418644 [Mycena latifolia]
MLQWLWSFLTATWRLSPTLTPAPAEDALAVKATPAFSYYVTDRNYITYLHHLQQVHHARRMGRIEPRTMRIRVERIRQELRHLRLARAQGRGHGQVSAEGIEQAWAFENTEGTSTRPMGEGARSSQLDQYVMHWGPAPSSVNALDHMRWGPAQSSDASLQASLATARQYAVYFKEVRLRSEAARLQLIEHYQVYLRWVELEQARRAGAVESPLPNWPSLARSATSGELAKLGAAGELSAGLTSAWNPPFTVLPN